MPAKTPPNKLSPSAASAPSRPKANAKSPKAIKGNPPKGNPPKGGNPKKGQGVKPAAEKEPEEEEEDDDKAVKTLVSFGRSWGVSIVLHVALLMLAMFMTLSLTPEKDISLNVSASETIQEDEMEPLEMKLDLAEMEEEVEVAEVSLALPETEVVAFEVPQVFAESPIAFAPSTEVLDMKTGGQDGSGEFEGVVKTKTKFFGTESTGGKFVFLVDNSNSMTRGKLESALAGLVEAIEKLDENQKFYVAFYSDTAYPLFYPNTEKEMVRATPANKQKLRNWLDTIPMCLRTSGRDALALAEQLKPDVLYILGDGAFTDNSGKKLIANPWKDVTIHTLGMQVKPKDAKDFEAIAKKHKGTYRDVGITDVGKSILASYGPRPRISIRTGIWGLKLPLTKPPKKK